MQVANQIVGIVAAIFLVFLERLNIPKLKIFENNNFYQADEKTKIHLCTTEIICRADDAPQT